MIKQGIKVYIETSVISGFGRKRFHNDLMKFFDLIREGVFIPIISEHTLSELYDDDTPIEVIENLNTIDYKQLATTDEMINLYDKYMEKRIVDENFKSDAMHVAIATILKVDVLVSWNLKHIANEITIPLFNKVSIKEGYTTLEIKNQRR
ncbi:MAG: hypothetical protein FWG98_06550 [Candidatus Cloacimonetes bacterium]|nr:hypothetical protein [Candidatus Cloacimonadota bacterium]